MTHTAEPMTLAQLIVRDVCETDPADPDQPETICVNASHLETIISSRIDAELAKQREDVPVAHELDCNLNMSDISQRLKGCDCYPQQRNAAEVTDEMALDVSNKYLAQIASEIIDID